MSKQVQVGFRGTEEYRHRLQEEAHKRHMKVQRMLELAVEAYLDDDALALSRIAPPVSKNPEEQRLVQQFLDLLRNGQPDVAGAVRNLVASHRPSGPVQKKHKVG